MFLKIYCTILILLLALARTVPDWFHPMIFLFPRVSQFWDASHRSGESGECLGWFWSQQWFHRIIKTNVHLHITSVCLLVSVCSLFVFASVIDTWRKSRKWGSQAGRQEEQGGGDERGNDFTDSIFCFSFAERTMPHKHFGITWFYLVLCEM